MSVDGKSNVDFHQKVDGKGAVIVLMKTSKGVTLGAYTQVGFTNSNQYKRDDNCVVFNVDTRFKQRIIGTPYAVEDFSQWGPRFDYGSVGLAGNPMDSKNGSCSVSRQTGILDDRKNRQVNLINGMHPLTLEESENFTCVECEVFQVIAIDL